MMIEEGGHFINSIRLIGQLKIENISVLIFKVIMFIIELIKASNL